MCIQITISNQKGWTAATFRLNFCRTILKVSKKYNFCIITCVRNFYPHFSSRWNFPHGFSFQKLDFHFANYRFLIYKITDFHFKDFRIFQNNRFPICLVSFRFASYSKPNATLKRNVTKQIVPIIILRDKWVHVIIIHNTYWARVVQMTAVWYQVSKPCLIPPRFSFHFEGRLFMF